MTSTKERVGPRKKGPLTWEALTRSVMACWRRVVLLRLGAGVGGI